LSAASDEKGEKESDSSFFCGKREEGENELVGKRSSGSNLSEKSVVGVVESVRGREQVRVCSRRRRGGSENGMAGAEWVRRDPKKQGRKEGTYQMQK